MPDDHVMIDAPATSLESMAAMEEVFARAIREDRKFRDRMRQELSAYLVSIEFVEEVVTTDTVEVTFEVKAPSHYSLRVAVIANRRAFSVQVQQHPEINCVHLVQPEWGVDTTQLAASILNGVLHVTMPRRVQTEPRQRG